MKILQTPVRFPPFIGGVENYVYNLSKELVRLGHEVTVICANEPKVRRDEVIDGIKIKRLPYVGKIANTNITMQFPFVLLREDFDMIHTHMPTPWSADWSAIVALIKRKPLILTYHNDVIGDKWFGKIATLYNRTNLKLILAIADKIIITQPNYVKSSPYLHKYEYKIEVVPVGVDYERFKPRGAKKKGNNKLFFLSVLDKFHKYKGLDCLLRAMVMVKKEVPDVKLVVGGTGDLINYYKQEADQLGLGGNVDFVGFIPEHEIVRYYNECDIFVLPSISAKQEGFGIVLLEAMACGKPVISTDIVGVAEDVKRMGAGIIVKPGNQEELANAIIYLLKNDEKAQIMGGIGKSFVKNNYNWKKIGRDIEQLYKNL